MSNEDTKQSNSQISEINSLLDCMEDGREFESINRISNRSNIRININLREEIQRSIKEISNATKCPNICYIANIINTKIPLSVSIDDNDQQPFSEMIDKIPSETKEIDVILVTPGGRIDQVKKFVDKLRPRFDKVNFILPYSAMSAGTVFALSGNELYMGPDSFLGPIDPQVPNSKGELLPAQSILTVIDDIQQRGDKLRKKGLEIPWTDLQILNNIDARHIGVALVASKNATDLVAKYLKKYKFADWDVRSSNKEPVTPEQKENRAQEIAELLCDHSKWKSHSHGINRNEIINECKLKVKKFEDTPNLLRAVKRFWALLYYLFERTTMSKLYISQNYFIIRNG